MSGRIRICRTHKRRVDDEARADGQACDYLEHDDEDGAWNRRCDPRDYIEAADGSALLAIKECAACDGKGEFATASTQPTADGYPTATVIRCPGCGGNGWTYEANAERGWCCRVERDRVWPEAEYGGRCKWAGDHAACGEVRVAVVVLAEEPTGEG